MHRPVSLGRFGRKATWVVLTLAVLNAAGGGVAPGRAACLPDPAPSGGAVSCTGTDANGFSAGAAVNLTVTVQPGATVSNAGIAPALTLNSGNTVTAAGAITSTRDGVRFTSGNNVQVLSGASISSGAIGLSATSTGNTIVNSGSIVTSGSSGDDGIRGSANNNTITNGATGTISARLDGIDARSGTAALPQQLINAGTITAGQVGIRALDFGSITNSNRITAGSDGIVLRAGNGFENEVGALLTSGRIGVSLTGAGNVILNEGTISTSGAAGDDGIRATADNNTITNGATGTISARLDGIDARSGTAALPQQLINAGTITAGQVGIRALDFGSITNSNRITAGSDGIVLRAGNGFENEVGALLTSGRIGVSLTGAGNVILNEGTISTSGAAGDDGIRGSANSNAITNAATGTINARLDGIEARSGTAASLQALTNDGVIIAGQDGIRAQDFNRVTNTGGVTAGLDGVEVRANSVVINATAGSLSAGRIGLSATSTGNTILNAGSIVTSGPAGDDGIRASADRNNITNDGTITARIDGIDARSGTAAQHQQLGNTGTITSGQDAIRALDFNDVTNGGTIDAGQDGIELRSSNALVNGIGATVTAAGAGARLTGSNNTVLNRGTIDSTGAAGITITGGGTNTITNEGTIAGSTFSIFGGGGADSVANSGLLEGDIALGNGSDTLTLASGAALDGDADGGGGADAMALDGAGSLGGAITRFETLTKTGSGTWRLTGGPSSVAATTVAAGELAVDGSLATQMTVLSGAVLSGSGSIVGDVDSVGGTVSPGGPTGQLTVSGNYSSDAASTLKVAIDDAGGGSRLSVGGMAGLDGRLQVDPLPGDYSAGGQIYDLLIATGGVAGQFADTVVTGALKYLLEYLADRVRLTTLRSDFAALAETHNQRSVGRYLDGISPTAGSDLADVFAELSMLAAEDIPDALDQLHPELYAAYDAASFASTRRLLSAAETRLAGIGQELYGQTAAISEPRLAAAIAASDTALGDWATLAPLGASWISAAGSTIDQDDEEEHLGYDARSFDLVIGADTKLAEGLIAGLAFSASTADIDWDDRGSTGEVKGLAGALYLAYLDTRFRIGALAGYGYDRYDTDRVIDFGGIDREARSHYGADRLFGALNGSYSLLRLKGWSADATTELSFIRLGTEDFEETSAGALNLDVDGRTQSSLRSEIGTTVARAISLAPDRTVTPHLSVGWAHEFLEDGAQIQSSFTGLGATFAVDGADQPKDSLLIGAGVTYEDSERLAVTLGYEGEIANDRVENSVRLGLALRF